MYYGTRRLTAACLAAAAAGALLHFVYGWWPNAVTALFSPVSESLWEHSKLIVWPYLAAAGLLNRDRPGGIYPWLLVLPGLCALMLALGWGYHVLLRGERMWVDVLLYLAVMALGFWLPGRACRPYSGRRKLLAVLLTALLVACVALFTLYPPDMILFRDLSAAGAWLPLPC